MILLPSPRRAALRAFAVLLGLAIAVLLSGSLALLGEFGLGLLVAVVIGLVTAAAYANPRLVATPYRMWNRAARVVARVGHRVVVEICYFTVVVPVGWASAREGLEAGATETSGWHSRSTLLRGAYGSLDHRVIPGRPGGDTVLRTVARWAPRSNRTWTLALIPFLVMAAALDTSRRNEAPEDVYTLY